MLLSFICFLPPYFISFLGTKGIRLSLVLLLYFTIINIILPEFQKRLLSKIEGCKPTMFRVSLRGILM